MNFGSMVRMGAKTVMDCVKVHSPGIKIGLGTAGLITAIGLGINATPKAIILLEDKRKNLKKEELTPKEVAETVWKTYLPTAATATFSTGLIILGCLENKNRNMALDAAFALTESAFKEYQDKVADIVGEKKEKEIREEVIKDHVRKDPPLRTDLPNNSKPWVYEPITEQYIRASWNDIEMCKNLYNSKIVGGACNYEPYNTFLEIIRERVDPSVSCTARGDMVGNNIDHLLEVDHSAEVYNDEPILVIVHKRNHEPRRNYSDDSSWR